MKLRANGRFQFSEAFPLEFTITNNIYLIFQFLDCIEMKLKTNEVFFFTLPKMCFLINLNHEWDLFALYSNFQM